MRNVMKMNTLKKYMSRLKKMTKSVDEIMPRVIKYITFTNSGSDLLERILEYLNSLFLDS